MSNFTKTADCGASDRASFWHRLVFLARFLKSDTCSISKRLKDAKQRIAIKQFFDLHRPSQDEMAVVCYGQIGDTYLLSRYAKAVKEKHRVSRIIYYVRERHGFIPKLFSAVDEVVSVPENLPIAHLFDPSTGGLYKKLPRIVGQSRALMWCMGYGELNHNDATKISLGLQPSAVPETPRRPTKEELTKAQEQLTKLGLLLGRTALLIPGAVSTAGRSEDKIPWDAIIALLEELGWKVLVNRGPEGNLLPAQSGFSPKLEEMRPLAMAAGMVISNRCGLTDLLSDLPVPHITFYPQIDWCMGRLLEVHGLAGNGLSKRALDIEIGESFGDEKLREFITKNSHV